MLKLILNYWQNNALFWALIVTLGITIGSLINPSYIAYPGVKISDKVLHFGAYIVLILSWLVYVKKNRVSINHWLVLIYLVVFGIIIELSQRYLTQSRTGEIWDIMSNTLGLFMGLMIFNFWIKKFIH